MVIAIIAILFSMLFPALQKATYQARLISCMNNLSQLGKAVLAYAEDNFDFYPRRQVNVMVGQQMMVLKRGVGQSAWDDRGLYSPYANLDTILICPFSTLSPGISLSSSYADTAGEVWTTYELWCGSKIYRDEYPAMPSLGVPANPGTDSEDNQTGMLRVGQRPTWPYSNFIPQFAAKSYTFNILSADLERLYEGAGGYYWITASHPDKSQELKPLELSAATGVGTYVLSNWFKDWGDGSGSTWGNPANLTRGPLDRNFLRDDGSVLTMADLAVRDPRLVKMPGFANLATWAVSFWLPPMELQ